MIMIAVHQFDVIKPKLTSLNPFTRTVELVVAHLAVIDPLSHPFFVSDLGNLGHCISLLSERFTALRTVELLPSNTVSTAFYSIRFELTTRLKYENQPVLNHLYLKQVRINHPTHNFSC